ncbi:hypothetical protein BY458DRAFT_589504 [Sporodiniella umbellata]|nr:hypothetical protein BY458DRAFT_589504 [Sporodiniella umbellata]
MSNDVCFKVENDFCLPPYSTECADVVSSPGHLSPLVEECSLQLKLVASSVDAWSSAPFECSCVLEDRFLLLGHREGIKLIDMEQPKPPTVIIWTRVRHIYVIASCGVIVMVSDKSKPVRCYSYEAVLKLVYSVLSLDWSTRKTRFDIPSFKDWQQVASKVAMNISSDAEEEVNVSGMNSLGSALKERLARKQKEKMPQKTCFIVDSLTKPFYVCNHIIPQEFHYKLPESKEALDLEFYQTNTYLFLAILHRDKIVLWQKKRDHPLRHFYRFKVFWIPTEAKAISFADDRNTLRHILVVFGAEATAIELRDCQVETIPIDATLRRIYETTWREQGETTLLASVPPIQWTSILQLPFFPHLPPTTLSTEYSIPPSYTTVMTTLASSAPPEPVALEASAQLFFATFGAQSFIIDVLGNLYSTQVFRWAEPPLHIEFIQLDQWYAIGFGHATVERMDMKSGRSQKIMHGVPVKFLGRWRQVLIWSCAAKQTHVYMLKNQ